MNVRSLDRLRDRRIPAALAVAAALVAFPLQPVRSQTPATITIATTPVDIGAQPFYAQSEGFFAKNGIDAKVQIISNGAAITAAVAGGTVDIAQSNIVSLATAHERGIPIVIIAPAGEYSSAHPTSALVVTKNSPIKTAKDLNGKTIAGNGLKNISQIGPQAWMAKNGGNPDTAKFVEMPFPEMSGALAGGRIDAALLAEPALSAALAHGDRVLGYAYDGIAKNFLIGAWFTTAAWAKAHPDLVKKFATSMAQTAVWANKNQAKSATVLNQYTKIVVEPNMARALYAERLDPRAMQPLIDASAKFGSIKASFPAVDLIAPEARP